jgi:hypothetical protein
MRVRILCGAYKLPSPFIDGGCACDWVEELQEGQSILCPDCGQHCDPEHAEGVRDKLLTRVVYVLGCTHRAFTFSRRTKAPFFCADSTPEEAREAGDVPDSPSGA